MLRVQLRDFLSYRDATLELADLTALVGPNASVKSNAVAAMKLLRDTALVGLPAALVGQGGFDQLPHRDRGRGSSPAVRLDFRVASAPLDSFYELQLVSVGRSRYEVVESARLFDDRGSYEFHHEARKFSAVDRAGHGGHSVAEYSGEISMPSGQSAVTLGASQGSRLVAAVLASIQTVEINPLRIAALQEVSSTGTFEPDGSNTATVLEVLPSQDKASLVDELSAIVPSIADVGVRMFEGMLAVSFRQDIADVIRENFWHDTCPREPCEHSAYC